MTKRSHMVTFPDGIPTDPALAQYLIGAMQKVMGDSPVVIDYAELHVRNDDAEFRVAAVVED